MERRERAWLWEGICSPVSSALLVTGEQTAFQCCTVMAEPEGFQKGGNQSTGTWDEKKSATKIRKKNTLPWSQMFLFLSLCVSPARSYKSWELLQPHFLNSLQLLLEYPREARWWVLQYKHIPRDCLAIHFLSCIISSKHKWALVYFEPRGPFQPQLLCDTNMTLLCSPNLESNSYKNHYRTLNPFRSCSEASRRCSMAWTLGLVPGCIQGTQEIFP